MVLQDSIEGTRLVCVPMYQIPPSGGRFTIFTKVCGLWNLRGWILYVCLLSDELYAVLPTWVSHLFIQSVAGTFGGFTTTIITNPLDVVRARLQVQRIDSMSRAFSNLWQEEGMRMFVKGLSARLVQSAMFSFSIILGYETIKRVSVNDEYKDYIRWWEFHFLHITKSAISRTIVVGTFREIHGLPVQKINI